MEAMKNSAEKKQQSPKRVGIVHVPYLVPGGEEVHVEALTRSYEALGYETFPFARSFLAKSASTAAITSLRGGSEEEWNALLASQNITFLHLHNIHPFLGPAFLRWILEKQVPALVTIHNHRFYCTNGLALYQGEICKACRGSASVARPILWNCNRSLGKSVYHSLALKQIREGNLLEQAALSILAPTPYMAAELKASGIRAEKIRVFAHGIDISAVETASNAKGGDIIFVARLSEEKGVRCLLAVVPLLPQFSFVVIGEGELKNEVREAASRHENLRFIERAPRAQVLAEMKASRVACVPSLCNESFSLVAGEALSLGLRLVVSDSESLQHFREAPFHAVSAEVRRPAILAEKLSTALAQPKLSSAEVLLLKERLGLSDFQDRLRHLLQELGL